MSKSDKNEEIKLFESINEFVNRIMSIVKFKLTRDGEAGTKKYYKMDPEILLIKKAIDLYNNKIQIDRSKLNDQEIREIYYIRNQLKTKRKDKNNEVIFSRNVFVSSQIQLLNQFEDQMKEESIQDRNLTILSLTSVLEALMTKIMEYIILNVYKDPSNVVDNKINLSDIGKYDTVRGIQEMAVEKYLDDLHRKSFKEQISILFDKCANSEGIKYPRTAQRIEIVNEIFQRRNLIVHNNGIVTKKYLNNSPKEFSESFKLGEKIITNNDYLVKATDTVLEIGIDIISRSFYKKKVFKNEYCRDNAEALGLRLMKLKKHYASRILFYYIKKYDSKETDEGGKFLSSFNYWLTYKLTDEINVKEKEICDYFDLITEPTQQQKFGFSALIDDKTEFIKYSIDYVENLKKELKNDHRKILNILEWPIFDVINSEEEFIAYKKNLFYNW